MPGLDDHRLVEREIADRDHAPGDDSQGTVATVAYPPFCPAHRGRGEVAPGSEPAPGFAPEQTEDSRAELRCRGLLPLGAANGPLELVLDHEVGQTFERALLDHPEAAQEEGA